MNSDENFIINSSKFREFWWIKFIIFADELLVISILEAHSRERGLGVQRVAAERLLAERPARRLLRVGGLHRGELGLELLHLRGLPRPLGP